MSGAVLLFIILGPIAILGGIGTMVAAVRGGVGQNPKSTAMLIAGMMATAFGMLLTAFAIFGRAPLPQGAN